MQTWWFPVKARCLFAGILNLFYSIGNIVCQGLKKMHNMGDFNTKIVVPKANDENFGFAFNDFDFSDRILRLEIISDNDHSKDSESYNGAKVVTLHISSVILVAKSPFFYKLFKNGMRESQHKNDVSLKINASEEATLMDLLNFMYGNSLSATSAPDLVDLLIVADKFEVTSCMRYTVQMLLDLPMSLEYALFYLELPSSVLMSEEAKPLIDASKKYVVARYNDFTKPLEEAMELPLSAIEVVLESEGLQVNSEDIVYDFMLKWTRKHYPELEERQEIVSKRLAPLICFPNLSSSKLKEVLVCPEFDHDQVSMLVMEALFSKVDLGTTNCNLSGRVYNPSLRVYNPRYVVHFDLKRDECSNLFPTNHIVSPHFCLSGKRLYLVAYCGQKEDRFGLFLFRETSSETCTLDYEFAVKKKSSKEFLIKHTSKNIYFEDDHGQGRADLLGIPWTEFMSDDNDYFIDDILHIRVKISIVNNSKP